MKKLFSLLAMIILIFSGLALWSTEWKEVRYDGGPNTDVRNDPFYAIIRYLELQHIDSDTARSLTPMNVPSFFRDKDALVLLGGYGVLGEDQLARILKWVGDGGHLILSPDNARPGFVDLKQDLLFEHFGVALELQWLSSESEESSEQDYQNSEQDHQDSEKGDQGSEKDLPAESANSSEAANSSEPSNSSKGDVQESLPTLIEELASFRDIRRCSRNNVVQVSLSDPKQAIELEVRSRVHLRLLNGQRAHRKVTDSRGLPVILQFDQGDGKVTLLSDGGIWTNSRVACRDHAFFLQYLLGEPTNVFFLLNRQQASLSELLFFYLPELVFSLMMMLVLWLWQRGVRLGPADQHRQRSRRHFFEHLLASARFRFRAGHHASMLGALREEICQRAAQRLDGFEVNDQSQHYRLLADHVGVSVVDIQMAMGAEAALSAADFQRAIRVLKKIRELL